MLPRSWWAVIVVASLLVASASVSVTPVAAQASPMEVYRQYLDAYGRRDVEAIVALFADDGVFVGGGGCRPTPCVGKPAIRRAYESQLTGNYQLTLLDTREEGDVIRWRASLQNDATRAAGVARIITAGTTEVHGDKITSLQGLPDPSDAITAQFIEWQARQAAAMPAVLPRAGEAEPGPMSSVVATFVAGVMLFGAGAALLYGRPAG